VAKGYEQIWDGEWEPLDKDWFLSCCSCGLVHRVQVRVRKGKPEICFTTDRRRTAQVRRYVTDLECKPRGKNNGR